MAERTAIKRFKYTFSLKNSSAFSLDDVICSNSTKFLPPILLDIIA
jgi:hypothetical protein